MRIPALLLMLMFSTATLAAEPGLAPELEGLRPFIGKTFRGDLGQKNGKPQIDVQHWERALNGRAVRNLHSTNDGEYGGETIFYWDAGAKELRYYYFTTAGYLTQGAITLEGRSFTAHETLSGDADGVTEVRSTGTLGEDGVYTTKAEYLQGGEWKPGHAGTYHEAPDARVIFR